jgi:hypothetical protein
MKPANLARPEEELRAVMRQPAVDCTKTPTGSFKEEHPRCFKDGTRLGVYHRNELSDYAFGGHPDEAEDSNIASAEHRVLRPLVRLALR